MSSYKHPLLPRDWSVDRTYHPEFGQYVYKPNIPGSRWIEACVTEEEAWAILEGIRWALDDANRESVGGKQDG